MLGLGVNLLFTLHCMARSYNQTEPGQYQLGDKTNIKWHGAYQSAPDCPFLFVVGVLVLDYFHMGTVFVMSAGNVVDGA